MGMAGMAAELDAPQTRFDTLVPSTPRIRLKDDATLALLPHVALLPLSCCKTLRCILNTTTQVAPLASASKKASGIKLQLQQLQQLHSTHSSDLKHLSLIS